MLSNRIHLNRILGLSNLYYIDPEDVEIRDELLTFAIVVSPYLICSESALEQIWSTEFGDRCGHWCVLEFNRFHSLLLTNQFARMLYTLNPDNGGGFGTNGAVNSFLVAMMYFIPGSMRVDDAEMKLPSWLLPHYQQIFQSALAKN